MKTNKIFTYGTLMRGESNFNFWKKSGANIKEIKKGIFLNGIMYDLGKYPAVQKGNNNIYGEIFIIDNISDCIKRIDYLESKYNRKICEIIDENNNKQNCWVYLYKNNYSIKRFSVIKSGNWRKHILSC
ncbi:MAG: gamma-glutamylcyclotransferase family protein [Bacillota bacterium]